MRTLLFLAVAGFAAAQQLSPAELEALARAEALINSLQPGWLKPKADRLARAAAGGPSIAAVAGDIVQSVGAGQAAVVKIDGITASTLTVTGATPDKFAATTLTVGAASIDVSFAFCVLATPTRQKSCCIWKFTLIRNRSDPALVQQADRTCPFATRVRHSGGRR
jgi:hypothetical protein